MKILKAGFQIIAGTVFGVYVAQNYDVPNVRKLANAGIKLLQHIEENYRKPKRKDGEDS